MKKSLIALLVLVAGATSSAAQTTQSVSGGLTGMGAPLAIHGYDPVAYFTTDHAMLGSSTFTAKHDGVAYRFVSEANLDAFQANPSAFLPQYGGFCAYGVSAGKKFDGDPRVFEIVDGKLYFNLNPSIQATWSEDIAANVRKADKEWGSLRKKPGHTAVADDAVNVSSGLTATGAPLGIHGYDPVAYFTTNQAMLGSAKFMAQHEGAAYRFASEDNLELFTANPAKYLPQFGGFCAYGASVGKKFDGDPRVFAVVDDKLYLNLNPQIQAEWNKGTAENIRKAEAQWKDIRSKKVASL